MLAIDVGTSFTTAAVLGGRDGPGVVGRPEIVEIEHSRYLPSVVVLDEDGTLVTGQSATALSGLLPERTERLPKRALVATDQVRLGATTVDTAELVAALITRVLGEARRRFGGPPPDQVVFTHPARWGEDELARLRLAASKAGVANTVFVPEPVAAAVWHAHQHDVPVGAHVAVYDFGGGTFDTAVLTRTPDGFVVLGRPGGDPHLGGEDLDEALHELVAAHASEAQPQAWERLWAGTGRAARRSQNLLRRDLTTAKEHLSRSPSATVLPPEFDDGIRITRPEFEDAVGDRLRATVAELVATVRGAGLVPGDLAAVYLTGGSSAVPMVSQLLTEELGTLPVATDDPKTVVVLGALLAQPTASATQAEQGGAERGEECEERTTTGSGGDGGVGTAESTPTPDRPAVRNDRLDILLAALGIAATILVFTQARDFTVLPATTWTVLSVLGLLASLVPSRWRTGSAGKVLDLVAGVGTGASLAMAWILGVTLAWDQPYHENLLWFHWHYAMKIAIVASVLLLVTARLMHRHASRGLHMGWPVVLAILLVGYGIGIDIGWTGRHRFRFQPVIVDLAYALVAVQLLMAVVAFARGSTPAARALGGFVIGVGALASIAAGGGHDVLAQAGITLVASDYYYDLIPALIPALLIGFRLTFRDRGGLFLPAASLAIVLPPTWVFLRLEHSPEKHLGLFCLVMLLGVAVADVVGPLLQRTAANRQSAATPSGTGESGQR
ncbi:Hsp70 family protein [Frankia sp. AgB1.9]|uniref:Hsp70 family protein n=1 Tax=unclassified Frankia TaxID=2632575 RepID=UPI001933D3B1|nr:MULTISPECIES: Hsp70 family protein [unclassified Frankia]MBL7488859.1 Hsp70 family protein [Frankia sp. AgW1.1]MBL7547595.1 Hsp70 family protein [Frankia sp. AgB1.9]MBL7619516.1 Hsp70 family protein [Frankia sp. AgB1.8]